MAGDPTENDTPFADFQVHEVDGAQVSATEGSQGVETNAKEPEADPNEPEIVDADEGEVTGDDTGSDTGADDESDDPADTGDDGDDGEDADGTDDGADEPAPKKKPNKVSAKDRIAGLVKERSQAQRDASAETARADAAEARIAELEAGTPAPDATPDATPAPANDEGKPKVGDFAYGELDTEYQEALTNWMVDTKLAARETAADEIRQQDAAEKAAQKVRDDYDTIVSAGIDAYDDFDEVVVKASDAGKYPMSEDTAMLVLGSEVGHHLIHKIATDLDFAQELAQKSPLEQARAIGKLEAQFPSSGDDTQEIPNVTTGAPTPPKTRKRGSGARTVDASSKNFADFEAQHQKANG